MQHMRSNAHKAIFRCVSLLGFAAVVLFATKANAQIAGTGNIQGTVTDTSGAVVAKASVSLTNRSTQVVRTSLSDNAGVYVFPGVPIGTYDLAVSAPGFKTEVTNGIVLEVGSSIAINATLPVGTTETRVEVQAEGLSLQTEDASFKQTDRKSVV